MKKKIPEFKNEDEEREFWATHDSTEFVDWKRAKKIEYVISKIGAAVDQIDWSIRLFLDYQAYVPAITLAGAAEEIIGETLGNQSAFSILKDELSTDYNLPGKIVSQSHLNKAKNWLKHWKELGDDETVSLDLESEAIQYIARSLANLVAHDRLFPSEAPRFFEWLQCNRQDLEAVRLLKKIPHKKPASGFFMGQDFR